MILLKYYLKQFFVYNIINNFSFNSVKIFICNENHNGIEYHHLKMFLYM